MSPRVTCSICGGSHPAFNCKRPAQKSAPVVVEKPATLTRAQALKMQDSILAAGVIVSADPKEIKRKRPKSAIVALPSGKLEHTLVVGVDPARDGDEASTVIGEKQPDGSIKILSMETTKPKRGRPSTGYDKRKADRERARAKRLAAAQARDAAAKAVKP